METEGELKLNEEAVKSITFEPEVAEPIRIYQDKPWLHFDESLPSVRQPSRKSEGYSPYAIQWDFKLAPLQAIRLGKRGAMVEGGTISGLDILQITSKNFWQFRKNKIRAQTLEALESYVRE